MTNISILKQPKSEKESKTENPKTQIPDYMVAFSGLSKSYCVCMVNMVESKEISPEMDEMTWCKYYEIFLNSMAKIIPRFGGVVIKNQGKSLLYYFPESARGTKYGFMSCLECTLAMLEEHDVICENLKQEGLPCMDYRISADYGKVVVMTANNSNSPDLIGPPVNMCAKINLAAEPNGSVLGGDLFCMVKGLDDYKFKELKGFSLGFKHPYPVYRLKRK